MHRIFVLVFLLSAPVVAQSPPTPDAVLVAGTVSSRAVDIAFQPLSIALAPDGSLYVAEQQRVWRVTTSGVLAPVAGPWDGSQVLISAIATDRAGNLYVAEVYQHLIWKLTPQGQATAIAGRGTQPLSDPGPVPANSVAAMASALAIDRQGNVYASGNNSRVWKITPDGLMRTVAGSGRPYDPPNSDAVPALSYGLLGPGRLASDNAGNLYIADASGLLRVSSDGQLRKLSAVVNSIAVDTAGNLYAGLRQSPDYVGQIARITADGAVKVIAGGPGEGVSDGCTSDAPGVTNALRATFAAPSDLVVDAAGNVYFADPAYGRVRLVSTDGRIRTVAGGPGGAFAGDGQAATDALLAHPAGLAIDSIGNLFFADRYNHRIRRIDPAGIIQTIVGNGATAGQDPVCVASTGVALASPSAVAVDPADNIYIADTRNHRILKLAADGTISAFAGTGAAGASGDGGPALLARLNAPAGLAFAFGNLYIAERDRVRYITPDGMINSLYAPIPNPTSVAVDASGNVFAGSLELTNDGHVFSLPLLQPRALATGAAGEIYSSDSYHRLSRIDSECSVAALSTFGPSFEGIAVAPAGDLFVSDSTANRIWRIPAPGKLHGTVPIALPPVSVVNGATLTPRTILVTESTRFGSVTVPVSTNEAVAPGETVSITGQCLGPLRLRTGPSADTQVLFNGTEAPLLSVSPNQVVAVVPSDLKGQSANMEVRYHGQQAAVKLETAATSVGIFAPANPTYIRGTIASLLITGEGQNAAPVQVKVGDTPAEVISVRPDPGTIGSTRVTFRIPGEIPAGSTKITVTVGSSSNAIPAQIL